MLFFKQELDMKLFITLKWHIIIVVVVSVNKFNDFEL